MYKVASEACDPVYGFDVFNITSKRISVNLVTDYSSMNDDVVTGNTPLCCVYIKGQNERRATARSWKLFYTGIARVTVCMWVCVCVRVKTSPER